MLKKLNLGCDKNYKEGYINLDINKNVKTDIIHNLNIFPYPFEDNYFDEIYCSHILEHVKNFLGCLKELERILKKGGILHIIVPHFSDGIGYGDIEHKRFFGYKTFKSIVHKGRSSEYDYSFVILENKYNFLSRNHPTLNKFFSLINLIPKDVYERFFCWIFPVSEVELKLKKT